MEVVGMRAGMEGLKDWISDGWCRWGFWEAWV